MSRICMVLGLLLTALAIATGTGSASTPDATLSVDPATKSVEQNEEFTLAIKLDSNVPASGAQTDIEFDRELLEVVDVVAGSSFQGASFLIGINPQTKEQAIAEANNSTGKVENVATFFVPGAGSAPAGRAEFAVVTFKARAVGGTSPITLSATESTDATGTSLVTTGTAGEVTVAGATASPTPVGQTPTPSPTPSPTPVPTPVPTPTPTPAAIQARMWVNPATLSVRPGAEFTVEVRQKTDIATGGSQTDLTFNPALLQVVSVSQSADFKAYKALPVIMGIVPPGGTPQGAAGAIASANTTGTLENVASFLTPPGTIPAGEAAFISVKFKAKDGQTGTSALTLVGYEMLNAAGENIGISATSGQVTLDVNAPAQPGALPASGGAPASESNALPWGLGLGAALLFGAAWAANAAAKRSR